MRWKSLYNRRVVQKAKSEHWQPWFAWYPVRFKNKLTGLYETVWLEEVYRKNSNIYRNNIEWEYSDLASIMLENERSEPTEECASELDPQAAMQQRFSQYTKGIII